VVAFEFSCDSRLELLNEAGGAGIRKELLTEFVRFPD
jgi:hypothetical protein